MLETCRAMFRPLIFDSFDAFYQDLTTFEDLDISDVNWKEIFDAQPAMMWLRSTWRYIWIVLLFYVALVFLGQHIMSSRESLYFRNAIFYWNCFLSIFSMMGFWYMLPVLLLSPHAGLLSKGLKATVCSNSSWYANGISGFFLFAFIVSKVFELVDTVWLVLGKRKVIFLHWYHHFTVLLFCWHAYSKAIPTGIWFAIVNYGVHSIMYTYYAMTQFNQAVRCFARPFAPFITIVQTSQMVLGLGIILSNMYYASSDPTCETSPSNNLLGLLMYFSYFVLFARIYLNRFLWRKATWAKAGDAARLTARPSKPETPRGKKGDSSKKSKRKNKRDPTKSVKAA
jgi:hypothetical protein